MLKVSWVSDSKRSNILLKGGDVTPKRHFGTNSSTVGRFQKREGQPESSALVNAIHSIFHLDRLEEAQDSYQDGCLKYLWL